MNINQRITIINTQLAALEEEREGLEEELERMKSNRWSTEARTERLRKAILSRYGSLHHIKLAILKATSEYDDCYHEYHGSLVLVDKDFNEVAHSIPTNDLFPKESDQRDMDGDQLVMEDITIRY